MIEYLTRENEINKVLRNQRKNKETIKILFHSPLWDDLSYNIAESAKNSDLALSDDKIYLIDTFDMPHAYCIFKLRKTPALVTIDDGGVGIVDYPPFIIKGLGIE